MLIETEGDFKTVQSLCLESEMFVDCVPLFGYLAYSPQT